MGLLVEFADKLRFDEDGATIVEYVLLIMFVAMACFTTVSYFGQSLIGPFQHAVNGLS